MSGLCCALKSSAAACYAWRKGKTYQLSPKRQQIAEAVKEVFYLHRRRYAARRISAELKATAMAARTPACRFNDENADSGGDWSAQVCAAHD